MTKPSIRAVDVEVAVAHWFNERQNIIVPNVSWGLDLHECDLLIMTARGYLTEVEIKVSAADLARDRKKHHQHGEWRHRIKALWFAVPADLAERTGQFPERAGILAVTVSYAVDEPMKMLEVRVVRPPQVDRLARPVNEKEHDQLLRLGCIRIWALKWKIMKLELELKRRKK